MIFPKPLLDRRTLQDGDQMLDQVLIEWDGKNPEDATCENLTDLEDKVIF